MTHFLICTTQVEYNSHGTLRHGVLTEGAIFFYVLESLFRFLLFFFLFPVSATVSATFPARGSIPDVMTGSYQPSTN